jgi:hypothetical protein
LSLRRHFLTNVLFRALFVFSAIITIQALINTSL